MEAYFDNSATTRCYPEVAEIVVKTMTEDFGNPSAMHLKGVEAEKYVKEATKTIAGILKVQEKEILFTASFILIVSCFTNFQAETSELTKLQALLFLCEEYVYPV